MALASQFRAIFDTVLTISKCADFILWGGRKAGRQKFARNKEVMA
jgi:hypothetical protein